MLKGIAIGVSVVAVSFGFVRQERQIDSLQAAQRSDEVAWQAIWKAHAKLETKFDVYVWECAAVKMQADYCPD